MRILVTATGWSPDRDAELKKIIASASKKYGDDLTVVVGYTAPHIKIAFTAYDLGTRVEAFSPDLDSMPTVYLDKTDGVSITNLGQLDYFKHVASKIDSVVAFDKTDPFIYHAKVLGKKIWFPLHDELT